MDETEKTLDSLPLDILRDIFLRLPVESLARLTFVSDFFDDFITNDLVYSVLERETPVIHSTASKGERLTNKDVLSKFRNMKFSNPFYLDEPFALAGSSNGLVCFYQSSEKLHPIYMYYNSNNTWEDPEYSNRIYIWNPALHQITALPKSIGANDFVAFGYDPSSQDYKILWISRGKRYKAEVYSWKKKSWKIICKNFRYIPNDSRDTYIVDFEGSLHWVSEVNQHIFCVSFNISDERLDVYRVPDCITPVRGNMMGVFRGSLSLLVHVRSWEIWSLDKSGVDCPWTKKYEPEFPVYNSDSDEEIIVMQKEYIRGLTASGNIMLSSSRGREYDLVDPDTISVEKLGALARSESYFFIDYVESLISVYPPCNPRVIS